MKVDRECAGEQIVRMGVARGERSPPGAGSGSQPLGRPGGCDLVLGITSWRREREELRSEREGHVLNQSREPKTEEQGLGRGDARTNHFVLCWTSRWTYPISSRKYGSGTQVPALV